MAMYIYASLPESYGSFYQIQQDNYPFNRIFHKYIQRIVGIGIENELDIFSLIGYIEHELSGDERLPDPPEGDQPITFRFSIEDEVVEQYYKEQDLSNKMITQMIVRMTIRLAGEYGTSLSRLATMIENINGTTRAVAPVVEEAPVTKEPAIKKKARPVKKARPAIRITEQDSEKERKNEVEIEEPAKELDKKKQPKETKVTTPDPSAESERLRKKLEELQKKQAEIEGTNEIADDSDDNDGQIVTTNPHLAEFFG